MEDNGSPAAYWLPMTLWGGPQKEYNRHKEEVNETKWKSTNPVTSSVPGVIYYSTLFNA